MAVPAKRRILSVRLRRPTGNQDLEVRFETPEYRDDVDAVFTSVDVVEKILVPFYQARDGSGQELLREVREQASGDVCLLLHKLHSERTASASDRLECRFSHCSLRRPALHDYCGSATNA